MSEIKHQYFCTKCGTERDSLLDHPAIGIGGYSWNCPRCNGPVDSREVVMNERPKKIWLSDEALWGGALEFQSDYEEEIPYIRADIVDELVETLKKLRVWTSPAIHNEYVKPMIEAALSKLEESHD